jgi:hypothetical protein
LIPIATSSKKKRKKKNKKNIPVEKPMSEEKKTRTGKKVEEMSDTELETLIQEINDK